MKGKTRLFKTLLMFVFTLTISLFLIACGDKNTDKADVAAAKTALVIDLKDNTSLTNVTSDLGLPTSLNNVTISWESTNADVVSTIGKVTRPDDADANVTLTATLSKGEENDTKDFAVTVKKREVVATEQDALDALTISGTNLVLEDGIYSTTANITLPSTSLGFDVNWESSSESALALDGTITRAPYGQGDTTVTLTAYIGALEKDFVVKVLAETVMPTTEILTKAQTQLILSKTETDEDMNLPTRIIVEGTFDETYETSVSWVSSKPNVMNSAGKISRPDLGESDEPVTLTATISYNNETVTKEISIIVLAIVESYEEFDNLTEAEAHFLNNIDKDSDRVYIKVKDVSLIGKMEDGLLFVDSEGIPFFAFGSTSNSYHNAETGKLYDIIGNFSNYYGVTQINGTGTASKGRPTILIEKEGAPVVPDVRTVESIAEYLPATMPKYDLTNRFVMDYIRVDAKIYIQSTTDNYGVFFMDKDYDGDYTDIGATTSVPYSPQGFVIYYTSNKDAFIPLDGLTVTVDVVLYGLRDDKGIYNAVFVGLADDINVHEMSDEQAVNAATIAAANQVSDVYVSAANITLISEMYGATVTWTSSHENIIGLDGKVTPVAGELNTVTLTATATKGDKTKSVSIDVKVGELPLLTVSQVLALNKGDLLKVKGTVVGYSAYNTLLLHDGTGSIALFIGSGTDSPLADTLKGSIGKVVTIEGSRTTYNGLNQIEKITKVTTSSESPVAANTANITALDWTPEALLPHQGKLVSIVDGVVSNVVIDQYDNVTVTIKLGDKTIDIKWDARVPMTGVNILATAVVDDIINVINAPLGWASNKPLIGYYASGQVTLTPDPNLVKHDVVFKDGETVLNTIQVVDGRQILEFPTLPLKEGFAFGGWFTDIEFTNEWELSNAVEEDLVLHAKWSPALNVVTTYDLSTSSASNSYVTTATEESIGDLTFIRLNTSFQTITGTSIKGYVLGIRSGNNWESPYLQVKEKVTGAHKVVFTVNNWTTDASYNLNFAEGIYIQTSNDGTTWTDGPNLKSTWNTGSSATNIISVDLTGDTFVRLYVRSAGSQSENNLRLVVSKMEIHKLVVAENPVNVSFDLNYEGAADPTVVTLEQDDKVTKPANPARNQFNFLGWALEGETDLYNFDSPVTEDITLVALWSAPELLDIADVKSEVAGNWVKFKGVVTGLTDYTQYNNRDYIYLQDETGAIMLYRAPLETIAVGDVYEVVGKLVNRNGLMQIEATGTTYTHLSEETMVVPPTTQIDDLADIVLALQSTKVSFEAIVKNVNTTTGQTLKVTIGTTEIDIRSDSNKPEDPINAHFLTAVVGKPVTITDMYVGWFNGPQLIPHNVSQVEFRDFTDAEKLDNAEALIKDTFDNKTFNMDTLLPDPDVDASLLGLTTDPADMIVDLQTAPRWATVASDTPVEITVSLESGDLTKDVVVNVTIKFVDENSSDLQSYNYGFDDYDLGKDYIDDQFSGPGGTNWNIGHSRNEDIYEIDGEGIMLRRGSDSHITITFTNGLSKLSFEFRKAFTGQTTRTLEVYINDVLYNEYTVNSGTGADDTVSTVLIEENYTGVVVVKIKPKVAGNHQITVDNFSWTENN